MQQENPIYDFKEFNFDKLKVEHGEDKRFVFSAEDFPSIFLIGGPLILKNYIFDDYEGIVTFANDSHEFAEFMDEFELHICEALSHIIESDVRIGDLRKKMKKVIDSKSAIRQKVVNDKSDGQLSLIVFSHDGQNAIEGLKIDNFLNFFNKGDKFLPVIRFDGCEVSDKQINILYEIVQLQQLSTPKNVLKKVDSEQIKEKSSKSKSKKETSNKKKTKPSKKKKTKKKSVSLSEDSETETESASDSYYSDDDSYDSEEEYSSSSSDEDIDIEHKRKTKKKRK